MQIWNVNSELVKKFVQGLEIDLRGNPAEIKSPSDVRGYATRYYPLPHVTRGAVSRDLTGFDRAVFECWTKLHPT